VKYRSRTDIVAAILEITLEGSVKTRIMYSAFLSYPQLKEYMKLLTESGLLDYSEENRKYYTSEKGRLFIRMYKEVGKLMTPKDSRTHHKVNLVHEHGLEAARHER
jgi:predicted transcriptional regulator